MTAPRLIMFLSAAAGISRTTCRAFSVPSLAVGTRTTAIAPPSARRAPPALRATTLAPVFDFSLSDPLAKSKSASSFERIDDAVMGGISQSSLRDVPGRPYASWSGVCRTDGGGFCGTRTLPFAYPLMAPEGAKGCYLVCRLASDDEAERRTWKMTVRTDSSRGEMVYQAEYDLRGAIDEAREGASGDGGDLRKAMEEANEAEQELERAMEGAKDVGHDEGKAMEQTEEAKRTLMEKTADLKRILHDLTDDAKGSRENESNGDDADGWARVTIPFDEFKLVRGPRLVPDGPKLNVTGGIFQIGFTLSRFVMAQNTTTLGNFRPGFFEMHVRSIGFYGDGGAVPAGTTASSSVPDTLSKEEAEKKRPMMLRALLPVLKLFFSEKASRRRSAMRILREERGLSRAGAISFGVRSRRRSMGAFPSAAKALGIVSTDAFRAVVFTALKITFLYPLRAVGAIVKRAKTTLGMKVKPSLRE